MTRRNEASCFRRSKRWAARLCGLVSLGLFVLSPATANAAFTQATCPSTGYDTPFPVRIGSTGFDTMINSSPTRYANRQHKQWNIFANWNVKWLQPRIGANFETESTYDWFKVIQGDTIFTYSGAYAAGYTSFPWTLFTSGFGHYVSATWHTDSSVTMPTQPVFDEARAWCLNTTQATVPMGAIARNTRYDGVLIKTGDVLYFSVTKLAGTDMRISVNVPDNGASSGANFDIYASTSTSMPDGSNYMIKDTSSALHAQVNLGYSAGGTTWFFGVRSAFGAGHAVIHAYSTTPSNMRTEKVCLNGITKAAGLTTNVRDSLKAASLWLYQATHGNHLVHTYNVTAMDLCSSEYCSACDPTCTICMDNPSVNPDWCGFQTSGGTIRIGYYTCGGYLNPTAWAGFTLAHEFGHKNLGLPDEYDWDPVDPNVWCGHTLMNSPVGNARGMCTPLNHCYDREGPPNSGVCGNSGWTLLSGYGFYPTNGTTESSDPAYWIVNSAQAKANIIVN